MNISVSEGETELEPGGNAFDWKAVAKLHPCIVKRLRTMVCGRGFSTNLRKRGREENTLVDHSFALRTIPNLLSETTALLVSSYCCST